MLLREYSSRSSQQQTTPLKPRASPLSRYGTLALRFKSSRQGDQPVSVPISENAESLANGRPVVVGVASLEETRGLLENDSIREEDEEEADFDNSDEFPSDGDETHGRAESAYLKSKLW